MTQTRIADVIKEHQLDTFTIAYLESALWTNDESPGSGEWSQHDGCSFADIHPDTIRSAKEDCEAFQEEQAEYLAELDYGETGRAGHDFFLTRNHHGAGFWDGGWPKEMGKALTNAAHVWNTWDLCRGDDGVFYHHS